MTACGCACHHGPHYPCTVPGGCGHLHPPSPADNEPVPHRCRRAHRCPGADHGTLGALIVAETGLCLPCEHHTRDAITALPRDYVLLTQALGPTTTGPAEVVAGSKDPPAPLAVPVAALAAELVDTACTWAEPVAERLNIEWDTTMMGRHTRPAPALHRACRLLAHHLPVLLALRGVEVLTWADDGTYRRVEPRDGIGAALEMLNLHHITQATLGLTRLTHRLPAPCPRCECMTLVRADGADDVHCQHCRIAWPSADYQRLTLILADDLQRAG